jgi:hypothetical protein
VFKTFVSISKEQKMSETPGWKFRLAAPTDAENFAKWVAMNPLIEASDVAAAQKTANPTVIYFAAENPDGVVVTFAPVYVQAIIAHLGFNPDATSEDRKIALQLGINGIIEFFALYGIREIVTLSKEGYPVAQWALGHGFDLEPRQVLRLDMNKQAALAEKE